MKLNTLAFLTASSLFLAACGNDKTATPESKTAEVPEATDLPLNSLEQKLSYIVGTNLAGQFQRDELSLDLDAFILAVNDVASGSESRLTQEQIQEAVATVQQQAQEKQLLAQQQASAKNVAEGLAYLEANAKKEGVVVTESGLQYKEIVAGDGEMPTSDKTVVVHYTGTLTDGTEFDSSYKRGEPAEFPVTGVIKGWVEALQLMNVGDKFELAIPSDLAYGAKGSGQTIGPDATLLFEVELLEIK
ncbi:FKBP-type peptidyl-prolyl cis-trans isomerase [uncultured Paraglaciecola sp.]|uniref:FKBP-type peptidyl-prolyl cis-trans isomerase n=1 Tax=uncultured Paraglaciecola sp. TaxID=1765024 RepID=UPI0030D73FF1|tara:strand:- start:8730 stop:9467 length:738 start_codon:yes stop_codon:yes gene_type:complete